MVTLLHEHRKNGGVIQALQVTIFKRGVRKALTTVTVVGRTKRGVEFGLPRRRRRLKQTLRRPAPLRIRLFYRDAFLVDPDPKLYRQRRARR